VIWWSGSVFAIASPYKRPYEYDPGTFPPGDWIVAYFAHAGDCVGSVAPGDCDGDGCARCSLFAGWRHEHGVIEYDSPLDIPDLTPGDSRIDQDRLGDSICGLCGGFIK